MPHYICTGSGNRVTDRCLGILLGHSGRRADPSAPRTFFAIITAAVVIRVVAPPEWKRPQQTTKDR